MTKRSITLPQRPAFIRSALSSVVASTYQLEDSGERKGSIYILSHNLEIGQCIRTPAGVFRFDFLEPSIIIAAVADGSLFTTSINETECSDTISVCEDVLLDVATVPESNVVSCTDKSGRVHLVDVVPGKVVTSWDAHVLPYTNSGCEVWTCAMRENLLCTGGEDGILKIWDLRSHSFVQQCRRFDAGVTFTSWIQSHSILTGSYDQHIRLFDVRNTKEPLIYVKTNGGVWHVENCEYGGTQHYLASCMYGGWALLDGDFKTIKSDETAGEQLLYGATKINDQYLMYVTFNDFTVTTTSL
ncbi:hypothetical protein Q1695_013682 [Nippostrongylus brasiliensis]|nr:hypothetical protein Q1695_013682 [Nippostrongylus brasiliensis]